MSPLNVYKTENMEEKKTTPPPRKTEDNGGIMLMLLIFILAGAFSSIAQAMGCVDSVVNLTLSILPGNFILVGMFVAACLVSLSIGTSCGTIAALTPIAVGIATATSANVPMATAVVVGGSLFHQLTLSIQQKYILLFLAFQV